MTSPVPLSSYALPGAPTDISPLEEQTVAAEKLGLSAVWFSEQQGPFKDGGATLGYMAHATESITIGTAVTHFDSRHPMVLASWGATMQHLSGGRFQFGFGRSVDSRWDAWGVRRPTLGSMGDTADLLRRLWAGERVTYEGPAGNFPLLNFGKFPEFTPPPLLLGAVGPKTLELAGRKFDGVFLHPFLTAEAVGNSRAIVRDAAEKAGRDPDSVRIHHQLVTAPDVSEEDLGEMAYARLAAYLDGKGLGEAIVSANGWDPALLPRLREAIVTAKQRNRERGNPLAGRALLVEPGMEVLPAELVMSAAAVGTPQECVATQRRYLDAGADEIVVHGVTAVGLDSTVEAFRASQ